MFLQNPRGVGSTTPGEKPLDRGNKGEYPIYAIKSIDSLDFQGYAPYETFKTR